MKWIIYDWIWRKWHGDLRMFFDRISGKRWIMENRPWWHICCNGDAGGWRTKFCHHFDEYIHTHEPPEGWS